MNEQGPQLSAENFFSKFRRPVCHQIPWLTVANFPHIVTNFLWPLNPTKYAVFVAGFATDRYSLSTKLTDNISDKPSSTFSVFLPSKPEWQSCISWWNHVYIQYGSLNSTKICHMCPLCHQPVPNSAKFRENIKIPWKWALGKFRGSAQNSACCGKLWSPTMKLHINQ